MPRYFFDVKTKERQVRDQVGMDLPDQHAIWPEIARLVHDCIQAAPLRSEMISVDVTVRDEAGRMIERCTSTAPPCEMSRYPEDVPRRSAASFSSISYQLS